MHSRSSWCSVVRDGLPTSEWHLREFGEGGCRLSRLVRLVIHVHHDRRDCILCRHYGIAAVPTINYGAIERIGMTAMPSSRTYPETQMTPSTEGAPVLVVSTTSTNLRREVAPASISFSPPSFTSNAPQRLSASWTMASTSSPLLSRQS